jgi:pimeloyl-ACP methyl ester carboxylesterase
MVGTIAGRTGFAARLGGSLLAVLALTAACSTARTEGTRATTAPPTASTASAAPDDCVGGGQARVVTMAHGQVTVLGHGPAGVVLSNQSDRDLCGWLPFGRVLAARGFQVLLHNGGMSGGDLVDDVAAAAGELRRLGARRVLLMGASQGAKASLVAAGGIHPPVAGVVSLSAEEGLRGIDVVKATTKVRVPVLLVTSRHDPYGSTEAAPELYRALAHAPSRQVLEVDGDAHGVDLLSGAVGPRVQAAVLGFLRHHAR